ncbi:MAG: serine/threonine protein kinase [Cyanobacteria bacterium REEB67]|nr:serine/threonine protein kinase [Cyanobacteria bacterium REEB67]
MAGEPLANDTSEEKIDPSLRATAAESSPVTAEEPAPVRPSRVLAGPPPDDMLGTIYVGRYELTSIIGSGGMGVIYQGKQIFLGRTVAIKMLKNNLASVKARMRFHQEAKAASALNHPGIVAISDFGVDEKDRPYMVMEHVEGCTFSDMLRERQTLTFGELLPVFLEICDALSEAHSKGIVHRDLKPSNIMLVSDADGQVHIKLLDFGIAKMHDLQENTLQDLTKTGEALGTPLYMSPEQIMSKKVTARSDLYSLGCMMYACLTGAPPFIGQNKLDTMEKHCSEAPVPLAEAAPDLDFPSGLDPIVMSLLEKSPEDRFASVDQLKDAIIDLAVRNKLMPRLGSQTVAPGQLYKTGVIPAMPRAIADMVPVNQATIGDHLLPEEDLADGAALTSTSGTGVLTRGERTSTSTARYARSAPTKNKGGVGAGRGRMLIISLSAIFVLLAVSVAFNFLKSRQGSVISQSAHPVEVAVVGEETKSKSSYVSCDERIHEMLLKDPNTMHVDIIDTAGMTPRCLEYLKAFKNLKMLRFSKSPIRDSELKCFSVLPIEILVLQYCPNISNFSISTIAKFPSLKAVDLTGTKIDDRGLKELGKYPNLDSFVLDDNLQITSTGVKNLLSAGSPIKLLSFDGCRIDDSCAEALAADTELRSLDISRNTGVSVEFLRRLRPIAAQMEELYLSQDFMNMYPDHVLAPFKRLRLLDVSFRPLCREAIEDICAMKLLKSVSVFRCQLTPEDYARLKRSQEAHRGQVWNEGPYRSVLGESWL